MSIKGKGRLYFESSSLSVRLLLETFVQMHVMMYQVVFAISTWLCGRLASLDRDLDARLFVGMMWAVAPLFFKCCRDSDEMNRVPNNDPAAATVGICL